MSDRQRGTWYALASVCLFATLGTGFKLSVRDLDSYSVVVWMGLFATAALLAECLRKGEGGRILEELRRKPFFFMVAGALGLGLQQILCLRAYELLSASEAVILTYTYPLMLVLLNRIFYRERSGYRSLMFVVLGFMGVYLLVSKGQWVTFDLGAGAFVALACAFSFALFCMLIKNGSFRVLPGMFLFNLFGLLFLVALLPLYGMTWRIPLTTVTLLAYLGIFPTALAFILWNRALQLIPTPQASNFALLTPLLSLVVIFLVLHDHMTLSQIPGMALILGSVFLSVHFGQR